MSFSWKEGMALSNLTLCLYPNNIFSMLGITFEPFAQQMVHYRIGSNFTACKMEFSRYLIAQFAEGFLRMDHSMDKSNFYICSKLIPDMMQMWFGYRHKINRKCPTSFLLFNRQWKQNLSIFSIHRVIMYFACVSCFLFEHV